MAILKNRIEKLEQDKNTNSMAIQRIALFYVDTDANTNGYECDGKIIRREPGESLERLQARAKAAVTWKQGQMDVKSFSVI